MRGISSRFRRTVLRLAVATVIVGGLLDGATPAQASTCLSSLYEAAGKYALCDLRFFGKLFAGAPIDPIERLVSKCAVAYARTWSKLVDKYGSDPFCSGPRFLVGTAVVVDQLTGLQWERKTDDGGIHDRDAVYTWSGGVSGADGTVFTDFLATLNGGSCFAGHCDWRLPTRQELEMLVAEPYPCTSPPCIDESSFGPSAAAFYWSSTTNPTGDGFLWGVQFATGVFGAYPKSLATAVRAVRTGR